MEKKKTAITPLIIKFVDLYLKNGRKNATQCLIEAGYEPGKKGGKNPRICAQRYASSVLTKEEVKEYIRKRELEIEEFAKCSPEWVVTMAKSNVEKALEGYPVYDRQGNYLYNKIDSAGLNGSLTIISKVLGLEKTSVEHSIKNEGFGLVLHIDGSEKKDGE